ncbi:CBS domain protein [Streptomyces sp. Ag82_O1-15]|uniref:CBS domain-containing protein n=1 Tax=Streptomyces sp. Ag82_O1-15 TaxID=1938855 RepID=UPI000BB10139|nr:CBS domain-containing protein [Streptomyces sp. Ag82_O1-15]PBC92433.1 CBS domain protein [Streptomyces sp. Ag82_O1-15]
MKKPTTAELIALKGAELALSDLLALYEVRVRQTGIIREMNESLAAAGLTTLPDFSTCPTLARVRLVPVAATTTVAPEEDPAVPVDPLPPGALPQRLLLGELPSAVVGLKCVPPGAALSQATYLMHYEGYNQIPVVSNMTELHGVVTWKSIALMYENGWETTLENAMQQESLPVFDSREDLFSCLPMLVDHGYVLVRGQDGRISGIVTYHEIVRRFQNTARPFFLLGEIESLLRRWLGARLDAEAVIAVQATNRKPEHRTGKVEDLMFGDYVLLLDGTQRRTALAQRADANWIALGRPALDRGQFVHHLQRVQTIRNRIAHFDDDPLPPEDMRDLTSFARQLRDCVR